MTVHPITFRTAAACDSAQIAALHAASWHSAYRGILSDAYLDGAIADERRQFWLTRLDRAGADHRYVLLAEQGDALVGFACVLLDADPPWGAELDNLHVQPGLRGRGLGRQLLVRAVHWVHTAAPQSPMHLWVFEANAPARRFYERCGGEALERSHKPMPDGTAPPLLRYVWRDLSLIAHGEEPL